MSSTRQTPRPSVMAVNEKYGGIDGHTGRQEVVDDFIETMTIERNKQKINKMLNAKKIQDWIDTIKYIIHPSPFQIRKERINCIIHQGV
jgi:hypothetical protein